MISEFSGVCSLPVLVEEGVAGRVARIVVLVEGDLDPDRLRFAGL
jgi:hypothetical protein